MHDAYSITFPMALNCFLCADVTLRGYNSARALSLCPLFLLSCLCLSYSSVCLSVAHARLVSRSKPKAI